MDQYTVQASEALVEEFIKAGAVRCVCCERFGVFSAGLW